MGGRNWLSFRTWGENHLFLVWACKLTYILFGWSKFTWFQCGGSNLTWFQCKTKWISRKRLHLSVVDRHWFGVCVAVENDLSFASASKLAVFLCRGIEIDLWIKIDLVWASGSNLTCFLCGGQNWLRFCVRAEKYLDLFMDRNWLGSKRVDRNWLGFDVGVGKDLVLVFGSELTWF